MDYYIKKTVTGSFDQVIIDVTDALKEEGFGIITEIDVKETLKKKINVDFRKYKILGACNPEFAHKALQVEENIGIMLPCNVVVQQKKPGSIEITVINPENVIKSIGNPQLEKFSEEVYQRLKNVLEKI